VINIVGNTNQIDMILDMSSNQPHITNDCPFCGAWEMLPAVATESKCKQCGAHFTFSEMQASGEIIVEWTATPEQLAAVQSEYKAN
jgi:uncharacterized protein (DUF983 family)